MTRLLHEKKPCKFEVFLEIRNVLQLTFQVGPHRLFIARKKKKNS